MANPAFAAAAKSGSPQKTAVANLAAAHDSAAAEPSPFGADPGRAAGAGLPGQNFADDDESPFGNAGYNRAI